MKTFTAVDLHSYLVLNSIYLNKSIFFKVGYMRGSSRFLKEDPLLTQLNCSPTLNLTVPRPNKVNVTCDVSVQTIGHQNYQPNT